MRQTTNLFLIDGEPILAPDTNMGISLEDIEAPDSGRDESGFYHRFLMRRNVGKWTFTYAHLTKDEYRYMEQLFADKDAFEFTYPDRADPAALQVTKAYRAKHSIDWYSAAIGLMRNYRFTIIEC